jgi:hypothetical protein
LEQKINKKEYDLQMTEFYDFGEEITKEREQDEPWYSDFQSVHQVFCSGPYPEERNPSFFERELNGLEFAITECKKYFKEFPGPPDWIPPSDERLIRWIKYFWKNEKEIEILEQMYLDDLKGEKNG